MKRSLKIAFWWLLPEFYISLEDIYLIFISLKGRTDVLAEINWNIKNTIIIIAADGRTTQPCFLRDFGPSQG
jgi:hypothetical protein